MDADGDGDVAKSGFFGSLDADSIEGALNTGTLTILGMLPSQGVVEPWIWMVSGMLQSPGCRQCQGCCESLHADDIRDAAKPRTVNVSEMLQSPGL